MNKLVSIFSLFLTLLISCFKSAELEVVYEWMTVVYDWDYMDESMDDWIASEDYKPDNNIISGVKIYKGTTFVTVPRWRTGVPSSLNKIVLDENTSEPLLRPYPSLEANDNYDCNQLQNVQSMEITPNGKMWIVDVGRKYFFDSSTSPDSSCPPKLWIYDIESDILEHVYIFPNEVANYTNSFLNDIVIDTVDQVAYISDVFGSPYNGGIVVYDYKKGKSNRFVSPQMQFDDDSSDALNFRINSYVLPLVAACDGIALSPDRRWLYFAAISSYGTYRVPTSVARNYQSDIRGWIQFLGNRTSQMDGMTFSDKGVLYYGSLAEDAVYQLDYQHKIDASIRTKYAPQNEMELVSDNYTLQWADTFAWGDDGYLYFTAARLHRFFLGNMDWSGGEGMNLRINRVFVNASSYMNYQEEIEPEPTTDGMEIIYEWTTTDYVWNEDTKNEYIANGEYIMENNVVSGVKVYKGTVFVTVPRWRAGVPSTLNKVNTNLDGTPLLQPYPSLEMQSITDCDMLQNVQSMEITPDGKMWIVDVGRKYFFDGVAAVDDTCPPKLWIYDIASDALEHVHVFPNDVAAQTNSFLNDIVIDVIDQVAYISDVFGTPYNGGIVVYDYNTDLSSRFVSPEMQYDEEGSEALLIHVNGYTLPLAAACDGIALSPDREWLYFAAISSYDTYRVPTSVVRSSSSDTNGDVEFLGARKSQMDGMTFSNDSVLYYGSFTETAVYQLAFDGDEIAESELSSYATDNGMELIADNVTIQWVDTFAWGDNGYLYFTAGRLHRYFLGNMDWSGAEGANFRVARVYVGSNSYMMGQLEMETSGDSTKSEGDDEGLNTAGVVLLLFVIILVIVIGVFILLWVKARGKSKGAYAAAGTHLQQESHQVQMS